MSTRRLGRDDSVMGSESGSRYDFGAYEGEDYRQHYLYLTRDGGMNGEEIEDFESESGDSQDISPYEDEEVHEQEEFESQAAAAALAQSAAEANSQITTGLMHRIASTLSISTPSLLKSEAQGAFETPKKLVSPAHDMEMSDEVASAAADLDRCIQVLLV
jgi:hypothetical protein